MAETEPAVRRATWADAAAVERLLAAENLPRDGVAEWLERFWVAEAEAAIVGAAGVELYGEIGLVRSVAVAPRWRGTGLGRRLTERAIEEAGRSGARQLYLLTTTADRYFPRLGFSEVPRESAPPELMASAEFRGACPASATLMRRALAD